MDNIFDIPSYYNNLTVEIASNSIRKLLENDPIEYMRFLYLEDKRSFYNLRDELLLRGIGFKNQYQNSYLLGRNFDIKFVIVKQRNSSAFSQINFGIHGASNFIERFNIKSDLFFHNAPWEGVCCFIPSGSIRLLKKEFERVGFSIVSVENYKALSLDNRDSYYIENIGSNIINDEQYKMKSNYSRLDLSVEYYFEDNIFRHFVNYCNNNKIEIFLDLTLDKIEDYGKEKFTRNKTVNLIKEKYLDISKKYNSLSYHFPRALELLENNRFKTLCEITDSDYLGHINNYFESNNTYDASFRIDKIKQFCNYVNNNIEKIVSERKKQEERNKFKLLVEQINEHSNYKYISSIEVQKLIELFAINEESLFAESLFLYELLDQEVSQPLIKKLLKALNSMYKLKDIVQITVDKLNSREREVVQLRETMTLQEIGEEIGVTRERIRQIELKAHSKIKGFKDRSLIEIYFKFYAEHTKLVHLHDFCESYNIHGLLERIIIKKNLDWSDNIHYLSRVDKYMDIDDYKLLDQSISMVDLKQPIVKTKKLMGLFPSENVGELSEVVDIIIKSHGYKRVNDIYVKEKISIIDRINYLFEHCITKPLCMDDQGYEYFKKMMNEVFGKKYDSSKRSATTRIADGTNVILVESNTFFKHENELITNEFLIAIEKKIDAILHSQPYADPRFIFDNNRSLVESVGLYSPMHLYSIIQLYLGDKYKTGHGNTLYIFKKETGVLDSERILLNYVSENGHEVSYDKVLEALHWKGYKLDQMLGRITSALMVKNRKVKTFESFEFTDSELHEIKSIVKSGIENGYIFTEDLAFDLAFNGKLERLNRQGYLTDITSLVSIVKCLFKNIYGHSRLLYSENSNIRTFEQVLTHEYPEIITREEISSFAEEKGYSEQRIISIPSTIVEENLFYPYSRTQFINANIINLNEDVKLSLKNYLDKQFENEPYKSMFSIIGYSQELLDISSYRWTEWLIYEFAEQVGYQKLIVDNPDYRSDQLVLIREDSETKSLSDLAYYIAKREYKGRMHEEDFARYLSSKNIIRNTRRLPFEIYSSELFEFDNFGFFHLR